MTARGSGWGSHCDDGGAVPRQWWRHPWGSMIGRGGNRGIGEEEDDRWRWCAGRVEGGSEGEEE